MRPGTGPFRLSPHGCVTILPRSASSAWRVPISLVEIDRPLDEDGAADLARRIGDLIAQPIDGIAEPLEAWIGITLRRVVDDVLAIRMEAERAANVLAASSGQPFVILTGRQ
jgi:hypothetical protein